MLGPLHQYRVHFAGHRVLGCAAEVGKPYHTGFFVKAVPTSHPPPKFMEAEKRNPSRLPLARITIFSASFYYRTLDKLEGTYTNDGFGS